MCVVGARVLINCLGWGLFDHCVWIWAVELGRGVGARFYCVENGTTAATTICCCRRCYWVLSKMSSAALIISTILWYRQAKEIGKERSKVEES